MDDPGTRLEAARAALDAWCGEVEGLPASGCDDKSFDINSLLRAGVHEWFSAEASGAAWLPPMAVLIGLAWRAISADAPASGGQVVWVGRRCWAYPHALVRRDPAEPGGAGDRLLLERSVFVDPPDRATRVWAIDLALRRPGVAVVIGDASGLTMAESRRVQLATVSRGGIGGAVGLLARPGWERRELSAARTRWLVTPTSAAESDLYEQSWTAELLRCKGVQPAVWSARAWRVRRDHGTGSIGEWTPSDGGVAADVVDRSAGASRASPGIARTRA